YFIRIFIMAALQIAQWRVALPDVGYGFWVLLFTTQLIISRLPFLPSRELFFLSATVALADASGAPEADLAGVMLVNAATFQIAHAVLFAAGSVFKRDAKKTV
ncbi:MAG: hypothetical protein AAF850_11065, partial [Pseudomonadota bacterium]